MRHMQLHCIESGSLCPSYCLRKILNYFMNLFFTKRMGLAPAFDTDRQFPEGAVEIDVDIVYDGQDMLIGAILEHIEDAGIKSRDSAAGG